MRITNKMMSNNYMRDMNRNLNNLNKINTQLTSGKEISRPSDNPFKVARSMQLHSDINTNSQYNENIKDTINHLETTDQALEQATNVMQRVRELMVSAGNAAYGSDEKQAITDEINEKYAEFTQILNTNFDGKYIFGGTKAGSKPLDIKEDPITGNKYMFYIDKDGNELKVDSEDPYTKNQLGMIDSELMVEVSQGVTMGYNVNATEVLNITNSDGKEINVMSLLSNITNNMQSENSLEQSEVINENLADIDDVISNMLRLRSEVGAKQNRMESAQTKNEDETFNMTDILSKTEDVDLTEKSIEYNVMYTVYMASLQASSKILPQTLMDFIR